MSSLNVLYDGQIFAVQEYGGVSRIFYQLVKHLVCHPQIDISLFHGFYVNKYPLKEYRKQLAYYFGLPAPGLPYTAKMTRLLNNLCFRLFHPGRSVDLFHPTFYSPAVVNWKKTPVVLPVFDMIPELFPDSFGDTAQRLALKKKCIERADAFIAISETTKNDLVRLYGIAPANVSVVYLGTPPPVSPEPNETEPHEPRVEQSRFILYVGIRRVKYKNFENLLQGFAEAPAINREFQLVCFGGNRFSPFEKNLISQLGLEDRVVHRSGNDALLAQYYRQAAVFVYPSLYEGFGLPPLEAMTYGCPVAASDTACLKETLGDAALYFDPLDPPAIANALDRLTTDKNKAEELIKKGNAQAKKYSWQKMADDTANVYLQLG